MFDVYIIHKISLEIETRGRYLKHEREDAFFYKSKFQADDELFLFFRPFFWAQ